MSKIPVAVQLYTLREETEKDFVGTLRKVAEIGYAGVEFAGYGGLSAREMKALLDELGLKPAGAHAGIEALETDLSAVIDYQLAIGNPYVGCPGLPEDRRKDAASWKRTAAQLTAIGEECARQGLVFYYHNHAIEFECFDGETGFDILFGNSDPRFLKMQPDLYWLKKGGADPVATIDKYAGRIPLVHIKDMANDAEGSFAEIGEGILDWPNIFAAAERAGVEWYIVEQDVCRRPPLESVALSLRNLKKMGIA